MARNRHSLPGWGCPVTRAERKSDFEAGRSVDDPERTSQSQSRPVVPDRGPDLSRRVAALKRCISSSIFSAFSSSCMVFDRFGASLLRNLSSTLPTESLLISAIVNSSALGKSTTAATSNQFDIARIDIAQRHVVFALVRCPLVVGCRWAIGAFSDERPALIRRPLTPSMQLQRYSLTRD
jgi:hypothetical protein